MIQKNNGDQSIIIKVAINRKIKATSSTYVYDDFLDFSFFFSFFVFFFFLGIFFFWGYFLTTHLFLSFPYFCFFFFFHLKIRRENLFLFLVFFFSLKHTQLKKIRCTNLGGRVSLPKDVFIYIYICIHLNFCLSPSFSRIKGERYTHQASIVIHIHTLTHTNTETSSFISSSSLRLIPHIPCDIIWVGIFSGGFSNLFLFSLTWGEENRSNIVMWGRVREDIYEVKAMDR